MAADNWTRTRLKWTVNGLSIVTAVLLVILLSLAIKWSTKRHQAFNYAEKTICAPCNELTWLDKKDLTGFVQKNESDSIYMTCCNLGSKVMDRLIAKHAILKYKDLAPTRLIASLDDRCKGKEMKPTSMYVKMTGINFTETANDKDNIIRWNTTISEGNIHMLDDKIFIDESGNYFVFFVLNFQIPIAGFNTVLTSYVKTQSYKHGYIRPILEYSKSFCEIKSDNREITIISGTAYYFGTNDKLYVQSSNPQYLSSSEYSNMFGLYKLD